MFRPGPDADGARRPYLTAALLAVLLVTGCTAEEEPRRVSHTPDTFELPEPVDPGVMEREAAGANPPPPPTPEQLLPDRKSVV